MSNTKKHLLYAINALPISAINLTLFVYFPKYIIEYGEITVAKAGFILLILKLIDLVLDPLIGVFNEYITNLGISRVRVTNLTIYPMALSLLALIYFTQFIDSPLVYFLVSFVFFLFWTVYNVAYVALGLELSDNYQERNHLFGKRDAFILGGSILGSALPVLLGLVLKNEEYLLLILAIIYSLLLVLTSSFLKKLKLNDSGNEQKFNLKNLLKVASDKSFILLGANLSLISFGQTLSGSLILIYIKYVLQNDSGKLYVLIFFTVSLLSIPLWIKIGKRFSKKITLICANFVSLAPLFVVITLGKGDHLIYLSMIVASALGIGGSLIMPSSMQSDITWKIKEEKGLKVEAYLGSLWSSLKKLSASIAIGLSFPILDYYGFKANQTQTDSTIDVIITLYALVPLICYIIATIIMCFYPSENKNI